MFEIPNLLPEYHEIVDAFIASEMIGVACTIYYKPTESACPNCYTSKSGSLNKYKTGGPVPFTLGVCPYCQGKGVFESLNTEAIRLRVYWTQKEWSKIKLPVEIKMADGDAIIMGFMSDVPKLKRCEYIQLINKQSYHKFECKLSSEPFPHGFGKERYFFAKVSRK